MAFLGSQFIASSHIRGGYKRRPTQCAGAGEGPICPSFSPSLDCTTAISSHWQLLSSMELELTPLCVPRSRQARGNVPEVPCSTSTTAGSRVQERKGPAANGKTVVAAHACKRPCHRSAAFPTLGCRACPPSPEHPTPACHSPSLARHSLGCVSIVTPMLACDSTPDWDPQESQCRPA
jgi:hypothetical protein